MNVDIDESQLYKSIPAYKQDSPAAMRQLFSNLKAQAMEETEKQAVECLPGEVITHFPRLTNAQKRLTLGMYFYALCGGEDLNVRGVSKLLKQDYHAWYQLVFNNPEAAQSISSFIAKLLDNSDFEYLGQVRASLRKKAIKGYYKHQELYLRLNGYLKETGPKGGLTINFQAFRDMTKLDSIVEVNEAGNEVTIKPPDSFDFLKDPEEKVNSEKDGQPF